MRTYFKSDYLKARNNYYHGDHNDADYQTLSSITGFMTKSGVYDKKSVKDTVDGWWKDLEKNAKEADMSVSEYLDQKEKEKQSNVLDFLIDSGKELSSGLFE